MKTPEAYVRDDCDKILESLSRCKIFKPPSKAAIGNKAVDRLCCINGRFVAIEYKREGKEPTALQAKFLRETIEAGGIAFWCDSVESFLLNMRMNGLMP